jgi:6-pyruvoyltetrahydropterin/6-carboxytetrahydropterin synthase
MQEKMASTENLAIEIWKLLEHRITEITSFGRLYSIKLYETPRNYVEYFGPVNPAK